MNQTMNKPISQILADAKMVKPIAITEDGKLCVSFEDYVNLTVADEVENNDLGLVEMNPDGTPACTPTKYLAVSLEQLFLNRYKVVTEGTEKKLYVVTDWLCIMRQNTGLTPVERIPCYVLSRGKDKKLMYEKTITISDDEFVSDFTGSLDREAMTQILPLLAKKDNGITKDKMPI